MKILQVIPFFTPARGGSVTVSYYLSKELSKSGHEVTIITTDFEFDEEYVKSIEGVNVISFKCIANHGLFLYSPSMKKWLRDNINNFDVVHLHNFRSYQNNVVYKYAKKYRIPYVLQAHGSLPRIIEKQRLKKLYDWAWGNKILKDAFKVIALTKTEAEQYKKMSVDGDRIEIIPNVIDLSEYDNLPEREEFRRKYCLNDNDKIILYLARIHKIKGPDLLAKAFAELTKELDNVKLVFVGPNDGYLPTLKKLINELRIENKVLFIGPLYGKEKLKAYVNADVYVLPSVYETFANTILEACACGVPVIVTDQCGIADFVDGKVGYVVEYDKNQLQDAIFRVLSNEGLRKRFGEEGKRLVREEFDLDKGVGQVEGVYKSVYSKGGLL